MQLTENLRARDARIDELTRVSIQNVESVNSENLKMKDARIVELEGMVKMMRVEVERLKNIRME